MLKVLSERAVKRMIDFALAPLKRKVRTMAMRAIVELVSDKPMLQTVQVSRADDLLDDEIECFQQYGFSSVAHKDAEAIVLLLGGSADVPVVIAVDDRRYRPTNNAEGEVLLYTKKHGIRLLLRDDKKVLLGTKPDKYAARADRVDSRLDTLESKHNGHTHITTATIGPSATPGVLSTTADPILGTESTACDEVLIK